jgi:hypothetical protein
VAAELVCCECQRRAAAGATGWRGYFVDADACHDEVVFFCASCAEREFGPSARAAPSGPDAEE